NPDLAAACAAAGITFVGPKAEILELAGNKSRAIAAAREAGLPGVKSSAPPAAAGELVAASGTVEVPPFGKAGVGGGGRGRRRLAKRSPRAAIGRCTWSGRCSLPATSRCRFWPTPTAT